MMGVGIRQPRGLIVVTAAVALILAACGGEDAEEPTTETVDETDPAGEDDPDDGATDSTGAEADGDGERLLAGELVTIVVGTSPGGGFDAYARLLAPFLAEELQADVTVENQPGAGGLLQLNNLWVADTDGTTIGIVNGAGVVGSVLGGAPGIEFELDEFSWLGRIAGEERVLSVNAGTTYESADELVGLGERFRFSATGPGGGTYNDAVLTCEVFEMTDCDVITGFDGSEESRLAVTAGEATGIVTTADSVIGDIEAGDHRALALLASERLEDDFPGVPTYAEVGGISDEGQAIAESMVAIVEAGRSMAAPPGMPDDILNELRRAFEAVLNSDEFLAEAEAQGRPIGYQDPDTYLEVIRTALGAPDIVREILAEGVE